MFSQVALSSNALSVPALAEALVYYKTVRVAASPGAITKLIEAFGAANVLSLLDAGVLEFYYDRSHTVVRTQNVPFAEHSFERMELVRDERGRPIRNIQDELNLQISRSSGGAGLSLLQRRRLVDGAVTRDPTDFILHGARADVLDQSFLNEGCNRLVKSLVPNFEAPRRFEFRSHETNQGFVLDTDFPFEAANTAYHQRVSPEHSSLTPGYLLAHFLGARREMFFSGDLQTDIWLDEAHSAIVTLKVDTLADKLEGGRTSIQHFERTVLERRSFAEMVEADPSTLDAVVRLVLSDATMRFKNEVHPADGQFDLLQAYDRSVLGRDPITGSMPFRVVKLLSFATAGFFAGTALVPLGLAAGAVGVAAGIATNALVDSADEFLVSKLQLGWKPDQWVKGSALPLLRSA